MAQHKTLPINVDASDLSQNQQLRAVNPAAAGSGGSAGTLGTELSPGLGRLCSHRALHPCTTLNTSPSTPTPRVHSPKLGKDPLLQHSQAGGRIVKEIWTPPKTQKNLNTPNTSFPLRNSDEVLWFVLGFRGEGSRQESCAALEQGRGMAAAFQRG